MTDDVRDLFDEPSVLARSASLRQMVRALLRDDDLVDDVVQETWLAAMQHPPRSGFEPGAWLRGIARNVTRHVWRADARRAGRERAAARPDHVPGPADVSAKIERFRELLEAVSGLCEPVRQAIVLRYLDGMMPREIAKRLSIPVATVKTRLNTGLRLLRDALDARHGGDRSEWRALLAPLVAPAGVTAASLSSATVVVTGGLVMKAGFVIGAIAIVAIVAIFLHSTANDGGRIDAVPRVALDSAGGDLRAGVEKADPKIAAAPFREAPPAEEFPPPSGAARARGPLEHVTLRGHCVAAESGEPLAGCKVTLQGLQGGTNNPFEWQHLDWRNPDPVTTGADGIFRFALGLPQFESSQTGWAPHLELDVSHPSRTSASGWVDFPDLPRGRTMDLGAVSLLRGVRRPIRVVDEDGAPVPGAPVLFSRSGEELIDPFLHPAIRASQQLFGRTGSDGMLQYRGILQAGTWTARLYEFGPESPVTFVVPPLLSIGPPVTIVTKMKAPGASTTISGRVVDQDGRPVKGLMVGAFKKRGYEPDGDPDSQFSWTADDGSFVIFARGQAGDEPMEVRCTRTRDRWGLLGECSWGERDLKLRLLAGATVAVRVVTEEGSPVEDFAVRCVPSEGVASTGPARLGGHFAEGLAEIRNVAPGPHRLLVFPFSSELAASEWQSIECPRSGRTEVRVTVARTIARRVHVGISGGAPVAGTKVELTFGGDAAPVLQSRVFAISLESSPVYPPGQQRIDEGLTDAAGDVVLRGPKSADNVWIRALGPGHPPATVSLVGWVAAVEPIEVAVAPSSTIRGRVGPLEVLDALDATNRRDDDSYSLDYTPRPHAYAKPKAGVERADRPRILALTPAESIATKDDKNPWWPLDREAPIGLDGTFEIADLPAGVFQLHLVTFTDRSGRFVFREPLAVVTASAERPVEVTLSIAPCLPRSLAGKVTLDGVPLANAEVELFWPGKVTGAEGSDTRPTAIVATLRTDRHGRFVIRPLAGEYAAVAVVPGAQDRPPTRIPAESAVRLDSGTNGPLEIAFTWKTIRFAEDSGQRAGPWITWHPNGQKHSEGVYKAGRREGPWTFWRIDGSADPELSGTYSDGIRTGP